MHPLKDSWLSMRHIRRYTVFTDEGACRDTGMSNNCDQASVYTTTMNACVCMCVHVYVCIYVQLYVQYVCGCVHVYIYMYVCMTMCVSR